MVAAIALVAVSVTGAALTWRYRPSGGGPAHLLPPSVSWSNRLVGWHEASMAAAAGALIVWGALIAWDRTIRARRKGTALGLAVSATALTALTAVAWQRARWEQLALWAVTVGSDVNGLWFAAFSDEVRFVFVDGSGEVTPNDLAPWVVAHMLAPILALAALVVGWLVAERSQTPQPAMELLDRSG